jgi:hypothetical protein
MTITTPTARMGLVQAADLLTKHLVDHQLLTLDVLGDAR